MRTPDLAVLPLDQTNPDEQKESPLELLTSCEGAKLLKANMLDYNAIKAPLRNFGAINSQAQLALATPRVTYLPSFILAQRLLSPVQTLCRPT